MDSEEKNHRSSKLSEPDFVFQWGKRLRCVRMKNPNVSAKSNGGIRRRITSRIVHAAGGSEPSRPQMINGFSRGSEPSTVGSVSVIGRKSSPEKEERYYTTRGSLYHHGGGGVNENGKPNGEGVGLGGAEEKGAAVWPKIYVTLSSKEKEEDFLAMKGCKPPQRPKKRAKLIQRTLLLVSPGAWLTDMCQERYEVREKKTSRKKPRGLKAMGSLESDSE